MINDFIQPLFDFLGIEWIGFIAIVLLVWFIAWIIKG